MSDDAAAAAGNARLVRCPNCKNLLQDLAGHPVFQCGGCGALLTADRRNVKSDEEMVGAVHSKSNNLLDKPQDDFVARNQGVGRALPSRIFNEVGKCPQFESNRGAQIQGNGMSSSVDKAEKMRDFRNDGALMLMSSNCLEEGPSNRTSLFKSGTRHKYLKGSKRVEQLEQDRLELLRKLEELNDQLRQSGTLPRTTNVKGMLGRDLAHNEPYGADGRMANDYPDMSKASKETYLNDKNFGRPPYYVNYPDSHPHADLHGPYMQGSYHRPHIQADTIRYGMSSESQMPGRPATSMSGQYAPHPNVPLYYPGQYIDSDPDTFKPYQHNASFHHPTCSCFQCYNIHHNTIPTAPRSNFPDGTYIDMPRYPMIYHHNHDSRITGGPSSLHDPTKRGSRVGNYESLRTYEVILSKGGRLCYPLVGGAPFMACHNCFELLQLPIINFLKPRDRQNKLQCGACSTLIYFSLQQNKLLIYEDSELRNESESSEVMDGGVLKSVGPVNQTDAECNSNDFDSLSNDFKLFDEDPALEVTFCDLNANETHGNNLISSSPASPSSTDEECSQLNMKASRNLLSSTAPPPGSPLHEHFDYSSNNHIINEDGKGSMSRRSDHGKVIPRAVVTADQNSLNEISMATEIEVSFDGYSNSGTSRDTGNGSKEYQNRQIMRKEGLAGIIKKSFKEIIKLDQGSEGDKTCVTINGQPISDQIIKKASRRAGRIQPGNYWYDIRAGFWGVMGGPCLGIIPPFIEELNYPFPKDCSGGMTGVFVNGRELHEKDLELLSGRGLPTTRDRSYVIEISGSVLDADSGKELDSLGRLARTVEKAKHGFGMKVPKQIVVNKYQSVNYIVRN